MKQLSLFNDPEQDKDNLEITVNKHGLQWVALIAGGWWQGVGKTKAQAVKRAKADYEREWTYYNE